jgi:hypothetical protein
MRDIDRVHQTLLAKRIKKCCLLDSKNETSASTTRIGSLLTEHVHIYIYIYIYIYRVWFDLALVDDVLADVVFVE